jgi:hypothetical protein
VTSLSLPALDAIRALPVVFVVKVFLSGLSVMVYVAGCMPVERVFARLKSLRG